jgi:hypothetical protein
VIVQLSTRAKVASFRQGLGDALGVIALGPETEASWKLAGIDAFYLSLTRAERWGVRPLAPHTLAVLRTPSVDQENGMPPFIITGVVLDAEDPNTAMFCIPLIVRELWRAVERINADQPGAIRTIGLFEFELTYPGSSLAESAKILVEALNAVGST